LAELPKSDKALAEHAADFEPMFYNIWKQQTKRHQDSRRLHDGGTNSDCVAGYTILSAYPWRLLDTTAKSQTFRQLAK